MSNIGQGHHMIAEERIRQIDEEGWTAEHDDAHTCSQLAWAAISYAAPDHVYKIWKSTNTYVFADPWPWDHKYDKRPRQGGAIKPNTPFYISRDERIRQLAKAGALIAAEIDRLMRAKGEGVHG